MVTAEDIAKVVEAFSPGARVEAVLDSRYPGDVYIAVSMPFWRWLFAIGAQGRHIESYLNEHPGRALGMRFNVFLTIRWGW